MNLQEIFDKVAMHLLAQRVRSKVGNRCMYRGENGTKCAIGCLIADKDYSINLEGAQISDRRLQKALRRSGVELHHSESEFSDSEWLLNELQYLHDFEDIERWPICLKDVAAQFRLNTGVISAIKGDQS